MNAANWNLDELVGKVLADLRAASASVSTSVPVAAQSDKKSGTKRETKPKISANSVASDVETARSAAIASAALARDFSALCVRRNVAAAKKENFETVSANVEFCVSERLLVAETVRRLAASTSEKRWRVRPNVVVTPSARDELKKASVELIFAERTAPNASLSASNVAGSVPNFATGEVVVKRSTKTAIRPSNVPVLSAIHLPQGDAFPKFVDEYLSRNFEVSVLRLDCLKETSKRIAAEIEKNKETRTILTTRDAAIGAIWTNRLAGVRSVVAFSVEQAKRDIVAANANVVLVDPRDVGPYPFRQIVEFFLTRGR